ncbi:peptidase S8/S53 domain-containing protein [Aspergillus taichungensis]|uniref:Peptidase S8/S53 domain-containing protein n=1 Tax=Aspergillus taichungensis TaxID=482145 RepID=A0A2J5I4S3_9EURO|nr:peptidase S8/S53 domain-containing protein [Aspergillus taichungensis]
MATPAAQINGNDITQDWAKEQRAKEGWSELETMGDSMTKYHLIILGEPLKRELKTKLGGFGVKILQHNGDNIYLCHCTRKEKLKTICDETGIHGMIPLPPDFKIEPSLKHLENDDDTQTVQISLRSETAASAEESEMKIEEDKQTIQMDVNNIAAIRGVRTIPEMRAITVADSGFDKGNLADVHPAKWQTNDTDGHGTHVCDSFKGAAPKSTLIMQSLDNGKINGKTKLATDMHKLLHQSYFNHASRVHTNSWGPVWRDPVTKELTGQCPYGEARAMDEFIYEHPDMCKLKVESPNKWWIGHIGSFAAAKNVITIGSCQNSGTSTDKSGIIYSPNGKNHWTQDDISPFSSHGPTFERRIKPDVVAPASRNPGFEYYGPAERPYWRYLSGTSMATPQVAGCVAVLREVLITKCNKPEPTAALIKALLINGATSLGKHIPRAQQGFGRVNLANSIIIPGEAESKNRAFVEGDLSDDLSDDPDRNKYRKEIDLSKYLPSDYVVSPIAPKLTLKVTMVYSDWAGEALQHNVNLGVSVPDHGFRYGNAHEDNYHKPDNLNNVEQVVWSGLEHKTQATIRVTLQNALMDDRSDAKQSFALVWSVTPDKS